MRPSKEMAWPCGGRAHAAWMGVGTMLNTATAMGLQYVAVRALGALAAHAVGHLQARRSRRQQALSRHLKRRKTASPKRSMSSMSL